MGRVTRRGKVMLAALIVAMMTFVATPAGAIGGKCLVEVHLGSINVCV